MMTFHPSETDPSTYPYMGNCQKPNRTEKSIKDLCVIVREGRTKINASGIITFEE